MPVFTYKGTNRSGGSVAGEMSASSKNELQGMLRRQQITATKMSEKGKEFNLPTFGSGVSAKELAPVLRHDRCWLATGAVSGNSCHPAGEQDLSKGPDGHALRC